MSVDFMAGKLVDGRHAYIEELEQFSVNVTNVNASMLLQLIGISTNELVGTISINDLRRIADKVDDVSLTEQSYEDNSSGAKLIYVGRSLDRLRGYSARLTKLANKAEKHEAEFISYA